MANLTGEELKSIVEYWKDELGLQDWKIGISICRRDDMVLKEACGKNQYMHQSKLSLIRILDEIDYGEERVEKQDQEKIIVHEILHCVFSTIDTDDVIKDRVQHQMIETLAKALVNAKRYKTEV